MVYPSLGLRNPREVVGNTYVDTELQDSSSEFAYPDQQIVTENLSFV